MNSLTPFSCIDTRNKHPHSWNMIRSFRKIIIYSFGKRCSARAAENPKHARLQQGRDAGAVAEPQTPLSPGVPRQMWQKESNPECLNCSAFLCFWKAKIKSIFHYKPPARTCYRHFLQHRTSLGRIFLHCDFPSISTQKYFCHVGALAI